MDWTWMAAALAVIALLAGLGWIWHTRRQQDAQPLAAHDRFTPVAALSDVQMTLMQYLVEAFAGRPVLFRAPLSQLVAPRGAGDRLQTQRRLAQHPDGDDGAHVHAQAAARRGAGLADAGLQVVEVGQQAHRAVVVGRAVGGHRDAAGGAVEQLHAQALLQRLHVLGDGGLGQRQRIGGARECAGFNDTGEYAHGLYLVHRPSWNPDNGWISAHRTRFCGR